MKARDLDKEGRVGGNNLFKWFLITNSGTTVSLDGLFGFYHFRCNLFPPITLLLLTTAAHLLEGNSNWDGADDGS